MLEPRGKPTEAIRGGRYISTPAFEHLFFHNLFTVVACGLNLSLILWHMVSSVKQVSFYDDDVRYWQLWRNRSAAAEAPTAVNNITSAFNSPAPSTKGRHFLVICCENKAIFLDLVTMRGRDVPKQDLDNRSLLWQVLNIPFSGRI